MPSRRPAQSQDSRACANDQAQVFPMMPLPLTVLFGQQECRGSAGGQGGRMFSIQGSRLAQPVKTGTTSIKKKKGKRKKEGHSQV